MDFDPQLIPIRNALAGLYPTRDQATAVLDEAGVETARIRFPDDARVSWHNILKEANNQGKVEAIVAIARRDYPGNTAWGAAPAATTPPANPNDALAPPVAGSIRNPVALSSQTPAATASKASEPAPAGVVTASEVVLLVHGIRTEAEWQAMVADVLGDIPGTVVWPLKYEFLDAVRFWFPVWTRRRSIEEVLWRIEEAIRINPDAKLSIIAHSFGTYAIGTILREKPAIRQRLHRLVLCGSILPRSFRWDQLRDPQQPAVINECGNRDIWPVLAKSTTTGYGASGTFGFGAPGVYDRHHNYDRAGSPFAHGSFFDREFVTKYWEPWFRENRLVKGDNPRSRSYWWSLLSVVQIKLIVLLALLALLLPWSRLQCRPNGYGDGTTSGISYLRAVELMGSAVEAGNWAYAQNRVLDKDVNWDGFVVSSDPPGYIIKPYKEEPKNRREFAYITLLNPRNHPAFVANEPIRVSGKISKFDEEGINIIGSTITDQ